MCEGFELKLSSRLFPSPPKLSTNRSRVLLLEASVQVMIFFNEQNGQHPGNFIHSELWYILVVEPSIFSLFSGVESLFHLHISYKAQEMARGNQRDLAREKNQKKIQELERRKGANNKGANQGMSLEQRKQRDAEVMRLKQLQALEKEKQQKSSTPT